MRGWYAAVAAAAAGAWLAMCAGAFFVGEAKGGPLACAGNATVHEIAPGAGGEWSVVILGDIAAGFPYLREVMTRAQRWSPAAFILVGEAAIKGDAAHLALATREFDKYASGAPVFAIPGERESEGEGAAAFLDAFGARTFDFRIGRTRFLGVDDAAGALAPLDKRLAEGEAEGDTVVVCAHRHLAEGEGLEAVLRRHPPAYVFTGEGGMSSHERRGETEFVGAPPSGERRIETDQTPISFLVLRRAGGRKHLALERFYRRNITELEGAFLHLALAHVRPLARERPVTFTVILAACVTCLVGWLAGMRGERSGER